MNVFLRDAILDTLVDLTIATVCLCFVSQEMDIGQFKWLCAHSLIVFVIFSFVPVLRRFFIVAFIGFCQFTWHPAPRTATLLTSTPDWFDVSCAAAIQSRRFSVGGVGRVTLFLFTNDMEHCRVSRAALAPSGVDLYCTDAIDSGALTMPDAYSELLFRRLRLAIYHVHAIRSKHDGLLVLDSDVALYRNIGARMARAGTDFVFQRELPCHSEPRRRCINAGVWWVSTRSDAALAVLYRALRLMVELRISDQDALQHALALSNATVTYLDPTRYPNGFLYNYDRRLRASRVHMVHVNWSPDGRAGKRYRLYDLGVADRYPRCFGEHMLREWRADRARNATRLESGFLLPLAMPRGVTWRDLGNALGCADVDDRRCIVARAEPRALPHYLTH